MSSKAEIYQENMAKLMSILNDTLSIDEHFFTDADGSCGEEIFEFFESAAIISGGLLKYIGGTIKPIDDKNLKVVITYLLNIGKKSLNIELSYNYMYGINEPKIASTLNELLEINGYSGERYYFDISQDVGMGGLAFSTFHQELNLFKNGVIYRGRSEFENSEDFEDFWSKLNNHQNSSGIKQNKNIGIEKINNDQLTYSRAKDEKLDKLISYPKIPSPKVNKWWKFW